MAISKRTLMKWRKESLITNYVLCKATPIPESYMDYHLNVIKLNNKILKMTQELLDQELMKEDK